MPESHHSLAFDARQFRRCLSSFATGVSVITTGTPGGDRAGVTVNSFSSVSLDPPLILWSMGLKAASLPIYQANPHFVVNILSARQRQLSEQFARAFSDKWSGVNYRIAESGCPVLADASANLHCRTIDMKTAGDHVIFMAQVDSIDHREDLEPLIYCRGSYLPAGVLEAQ